MIVWGVAGLAGWRLAGGWAGYVLMLGVRLCLNGKGVFFIKTAKPVRRVIMYIMNNTLCNDFNGLAV